MKNLQNERFGKYKVFLLRQDFVISDNKYRRYMFFQLSIINKYRYNEHNWFWNFLCYSIYPIVLIYIGILHVEIIRSQIQFI